MPTFADPPAAPPGAPDRWTVGERDAGERLDRHVADRLGVPRHQVRRWLDEGRIELDGAVARASARVRAGQAVQCRRGDPPALARPLLAEAGELPILFADPHLFAFDKPAGLVVHPGAGRSLGTLVNRLLALDPAIARVGGAGRPGIVHRLDRETTGVLVVARTPNAHGALSAAFAERRVQKTYLAIVHGRPRRASGTIDAPIGRDPRDRKRMAVVERGGRAAKTHWETLESVAGASLLRVGIETGRTHQIRVHLKSAGHPLVGDPTYGEARWRALREPARTVVRQFPRPALHAWRLVLRHPFEPRDLEITAPPPADLADLWRALGGSAIAASPAP